MKITPAVYRTYQLRELGLAAGEDGGIPRQRPGRRGGERPRHHPSPGRQHLGCPGLAPGRRDEQLPDRSGQAQRGGQQLGGVLVGGAGETPLQVTDRTAAQGRGLGQLLLGSA
jgi:hypothetical protein